MAQCLTSKGWAATAGPDGGFGNTVGIPDEQYDRYESDIAACRASLGYDTDFKVTPEIAGSFYDKLVASAECLRHRIGNI